MVMIKRNGFTLTELLVTVAIVGVLFGIGPTIFLQANRFIQLNTTRVQLQREARLILSIINRNLRQAQAGTISIDRAGTQPYYSRISFTTIDGMSYTFFQQGTNLVMTTSNTSKTLTSSLRYLAFAPPRTENLTIISVSLTLEKTIYEGKTKALHMASEKVMIMN